jgi:hypothetical protein
MHNLQSKFIAKSVRNLNYGTTCFGLWRPSSGQEFEYSKAGGDFWVVSCVWGVEGGSRSRSSSSLSKSMGEISRGRGAQT